MYQDFREQDIPIRPRYGILEEPPADETQSTATDAQMEEERKTAKPRKASTSDQQFVSSSYSEIPFLAQYPAEVPEHVLKAVPQKPELQPSDSLEEDDDSNNSNHSSGNRNQRPQSLQCDSSVPYELEGATTADGEMRHFVAEDSEAKQRLDREGELSGFASQSSTPSTSGKGMLTQRFLQSQVPQIDANVLLTDIEIEAHYLAGSVDNLMENLCNLLHSISTITADNVEVHKNAVTKLTDCMDGNIKCMYTIMAKTEEISKAMKPSEQLGQRIREIKRLVDMLENTM